MAKGAFIEGADDSHKAGDNIDSGLPNITGKLRGMLLADRGERTFEGAFVYGGVDNPNNGSLDGTNGDGDVAGYTDNSSGKLIAFKLDAHSYNNIYGNSDTVQPKEYVSHYWLRVK